LSWIELRIPSAKELHELRLHYRGKARFLIDESMGSGVADILRGFGYNSKYVGEINLLGHGDEEIFAAAWTEKRIVVTHDPDFLDDRRFPPHRNRGIVLIRPGSNERDNHGLLVCLTKATLIAGDNAQWFEGKKLDFSCEEFLAIASEGVPRQRYRWGKHQNPMVWEQD
jgi:predicted nuclease of predicted toxin-antitoxin system